MPLEEAGTLYDRVLITTRDKPDGGINTKEIDELIAKLFD